MRACPGYESWLPSNDICQSLNIFGHIADEIEGPVITRRVPVIDHHVTILIKLREERRLDLRMLLPVLASVNKPINQIFSISLADQHGRDTNTSTRTIIGHGHLGDILFFLVIYYDGHGATMPLNIPCNLNERAFSRVVHHKVDKTLLLLIVVIALLLKRIVHQIAT